MSKKDFLKQKYFFFRFLKEKNAFSKYMKYIHCGKYDNVVQMDCLNWDFDSVAKKLGMTEMITSLIMWSSTPEGYRYWLALHTEFKEKFHQTFLKHALDI